MESILAAILVPLLTKLGGFLLDALFDGVKFIQFKKKVEESIEKANENGNTSDLEGIFRNL